MIVEGREKTLHENEIEIEEQKQAPATRKSNVYIPPVKRLDWIDGMRGIAEMVIIIHHFGDNTFSQRNTDILSWSSPQVWLR
jgi:hypothetical protein